MKTTTKFGIAGVMATVLAAGVVAQQPSNSTSKSGST